MLTALKKFFAPSPQRLQAHEVYAHIVQTARNPRLYKEFGVPDTLDGRFDVIVLHLFLVVQRLRAIPQTAEVERDLTEIFFDDMDRTLRELGVGDTGVGKRIKQMVSAYYGRFAAYEAAGSDDALLATAFARNLYLAPLQQCPQANMLVAYARTLQNVLMACDVEAIQAGAWTV